MFFHHSDKIDTFVNVEVWRKVSTEGGFEDTWGEAVPSSDPAPVPALYGRELSHVIYGCVMEPRTTRVETRPEYNERMTFTGITFFMNAYADVKPDDYFAFVNHNGQYEVFKVEGEGDINNYVSPHSGIVGGREVFAMRYREAK